jgi:hypothetical protein
MRVHQQDLKWVYASGVADVFCGESHTDTACPPLASIPGNSASKMLFNEGDLVPRVAIRATVCTRLWTQSQHLGSLRAPGRHGRWPGDVSVAGSGPSNASVSLLEDGSVTS